MSRPPLTVVQENELGGGPSRIVGFRETTTRFEEAVPRPDQQAQQEDAGTGLAEAASAALGVAEARIKRASMVASSNGGVEIEAPEVDDPFKVAVSERETYFTVNGTPALVALGDSAEARALAQLLEVEDEGIYVGVKPEATRANYCRMEQRLLKEKAEGKLGVRWFGRDGALGNLPDPLRGGLMRPSQWYDPDAEYLETQYIRWVRPPSSKHVVFTDGEDFRYRLDVDVRDLVVYDHPLFSKEEFLAQRLLQLCEKYAGRKELGLPQFYSERLRALTVSRNALLAQVGTYHSQSSANLGAATLASSSQSMSSLHVPPLVFGFGDDPLSMSGEGSLLSPHVSALSTSTANLPLTPGSSAAARQNAAATRMQALSQAVKKAAGMRRDIAQLRRLKDAEELADRLLIHEIVDVWNRLKRVRVEQGFSSTSAKLVIRFAKEAPEVLQRLYAAEIDDEVNDLRDEHTARRQAQVSAYHLAMAEYRKKKARLEEERRLEDEQQREVALRGAEPQVLTPAPTALDENKHLMSTASKRHQRSLQISEEEAALVMPVLEDEVPFDEPAVRATIVERYERTKRRPGEDILDPVLMDSNPITPDESVPRPERARREQKRKLRFHVRVLVNGKLVTKSRSVLTGDDLVVRIGEVYALQLAQWPEAIALEIFEDGSSIVPGGGHTVATVYLNIPGEGESFRTDPAPDRYLFASDAVFLPPWVEFTGAPAAASSSSSPPASPRKTGTTHEHFTHGAVEVVSQWKGTAASAAAGPKGAICPPHRTRPPPPPEQMSKLGHASRRKISQWVKDTDLDPNDPRNAAVMSVLRDMKETQGLEQRFRVTPEEKGLLLPHAEGQIEPRRHAILRARADGEVSAWQVPLFDHLIDNAIFREQKEGGGGGGDAPAVGVAEASRLPAYVLALREKAAKRHKSEFKYDVNDVINEEPVPLRDFSLGNIAFFFRPRRKLNPARAERKPVTSFVEQCNLLVQVTRGYNVPVRATSIANHPLDPYPGTEAEVDPSGVTIRSFVEVCFYNHTARTRAADDTNPQWSELLSVPFVPPGNDFSPSALASVRSSITFNIYDELTINNPRDDRDTNAIDLKKERRWLGSVEVPFRYIYENVKIEGIFQVQRPPVILGYTSAEKAIAQSGNMGPLSVAAGVASRRLAQAQTAGGGGGGGGGGGIGNASLALASQRRGAGMTSMANMGLASTRGGGGGMGAGLQQQQQQGAVASAMADGAPEPQTMIGLFMTFDPLLAQPPGEGILEASTENRRFNEYAFKWVSDTKALKQCKGRNIACVATNIRGETVCITRYIHPQAPPPELRTVLQLARFVSLIPYVDDSMAFDIQAGGSVWATSREFLEMNSGDEEEHAILLCNYFLYNKIQAYVVLGTGFPEGPTSYVLTRDQGSGAQLLWNPSTGEQYATEDPQCALKSIGCVFNRENIWANVQLTDVPHKMHFNLADESSWKPFFTEVNSAHNPNDFATVQTDQLYYAPTPASASLELETRIEAALGKAVEGARTRFVTQWDMACSRTLKVLLRDFELDKLGEVPFSLKKHNEALGSFWTLYHMHGSPMNRPFSTNQQSVDSIISAVLATGTHLSEDDDCRFAKAVYVSPYANRIMSVWIYFICLKPLK